MGDHEPAWASAAAPVNAGASSSSGGASGKPEHPHKKAFTIAAMVLNLGFSFMIAADGAIAIGNANDASDAGLVFVGLYMILFSAILFTYEVLQIKPNSSLDEIYKKNFGFLYGPLGKSCYLLFIGVLAFGLTTPSWSLATGILVTIWAFIYGGVSVWKPDLFDVKEKYNPEYE